jgi:hypothetical protein
MWRLARAWGDSAGVAEAVASLGQSAGNAGTSRCAAGFPACRPDPASDTLVANFDLMPDVDDVHAAAALGTLLAPHRGCIDDAQRAVSSSASC